eukprot:690607-Pyramimonas_sp.AAC.1
MAGPRIETSRRRMSGRAHPPPALHAEAAAARRPSAGVGGGSAEAGEEREAPGARGAQGCNVSSWS